MSLSLTLRYPFDTAYSNAVSPEVVRRFTSAPWRRRIPTIDSNPRLAASIRGELLCGPSTFTSTPAANNSTTWPASPFWHAKIRGSNFVFFVGINPPIFKPINPPIPSNPPPIRNQKSAPSNLPTPFSQTPRPIIHADAARSDSPHFQNKLDPINCKLCSTDCIYCPTASGATESPCD